MAKHAHLPNPVPKPKTIVQQQTDFTAEGSPPPGKVATADPVVARKVKGVVAPVPHASGKRPPHGQSR